MHRHQAHWKAFPARRHRTGPTPNGLEAVQRRVVGPGIHAVNNRGGSMFFCLQPRVLLALLAQAVRGCDDKALLEKRKTLEDSSVFLFLQEKETPNTAGATTTPSLSTSTWTASSQARETCAGKGGTELIIFLSTPSRP